MPLIRVDWPSVWDEFETVDPGCLSIINEEKRRERIEKIVNEQIDAQEAQYPELCCKPPPDAIMEKKIIEAARRASRSGSVRDLREYLKLRREYEGDKIMNNYIYGKIMPHLSEYGKWQFKRWFAWIMPDETTERTVIIDDTKEAVERRTQKLIKLLKAGSPDVREYFEYLKLRKAKNDND